MKNIKENIIKTTSALLILVMMFGVSIRAYAEENPEPATVELTIRSGETIIFDNQVPLQAAGTIDINGHQVDAHSVLSVLRDADTSDDSWSVTDLTYFDSFGAFYLKCLQSSVGQNCDNWQYAVDGSYSSASIDQNILNGGEHAYIYFGPQTKILLSSNTITTSQSVTLTAQNYDYENNTWTTRTDVNAGLTQPNPNDPYSPIEVTTVPVDSNGKATFSNIAVGSYNVGIQEDFYFPTESLTVTAAQTGGGGGGGHSGGTTTTPTPAVLGTTTKAQFNLEKAFDFLISKQKENGSFGEEIYTDWSGVALASGTHQEQTIKLIKYLVTNKSAGTMLTDYERHALVLLSLGLNPYNTNGENYVGKITASFDGKQFGDVHEDNDDIFAVIVLTHAGYKTDEKMLNDSVDFILGRQKENGSWDESVDMTGAGIEALTTMADKSETPQNKKLLLAITKAKDFLKQNQKDTGGWANVSATSWAIEGIRALGENPADWKVGENTPLDYLGANQDTDGGIKNENEKTKLWETAYAITAYTGKTWNKIMQTYEKPADGSVLGATTEIKPKNKVKSVKVAVKPKATIANSIKLDPPVAPTPTPAPEAPVAPVEQSWIKKLFSGIWNAF